MKAVLLIGEPAPGASRADEADTLVQAAQVQGLLEAAGWSVCLLELTADLPAAKIALLREKPDLVFNLVESIGGKGDFIHLGPALLEHLGLPYTGCPQSAVYLSSNKVLAKRFLSLAGLPVPAAWDADAHDATVRGKRQNDEPLWIVKSMWEHASLGLDAGSVIPSRAVEALIARRKARYGGEWFAESYVPGREFNLSLLEGSAGPEVLSPAEIVFDAFPMGKPRIVDYAAKWQPDTFEYRNTPRRFGFGPDDAELLERLRGLALETWDLFGMRGYARVDFRVDAAGHPWILEVNANPCLSADAGFMAAAAETGLSDSEVIERIVNSTPRCNPRRLQLRKACS